MLFAVETCYLLLAVTLVDLRGGEESFMSYRLSFIHTIQKQIAVYTHHGSTLMTYMHLI